MYFREQVAAERTANTCDILKTSRPQAIEVKINGNSLFEEERVVLDFWRLLQGNTIDTTEDTPYTIPFCQHPEDNSSSGFLPASQDAMSIYYTAEQTGFVDIIVEYEKMQRRTEQGRLESADS